MTVIANEAKEHEMKINKELMTTAQARTSIHRCKPARDKGLYLLVFFLGWLSGLLTLPLIFK